MPTVFGLIFGLVVLLLLMMAMGSANNVLYLFVFFLASVSISAMVITNDNLQRVRLEQITGAGAIFAQESATFSVLLKNQDSKSGYFVEVKVGAHQSQIEEVPARQDRIVLVRGGSFDRGYQKIPKAQIATTFPFGMLRSWKIYRNKNTFLVYPARKGALPFPLSSENSDSLGEVGLFRDLREYQTTDSPRRIDWRASLKHDKMLIKNFESLAEKSHAFNWQQSQPAGSFEDRVSQLAQWVDQAEKLGLQYSLEVGSLKTETKRGSSQYHLCMEHLARLQSDLSLSAEAG